MCCYPLEEWAVQEIVVGEEAWVILKWMLESLWEVFHDLFPVAALDWIWWDRTILPVLDFNENLSLLLKMWSGDCVHLNLIPISIWKQLDFKKKEKHPKLIMSWMKGIIDSPFSRKIKRCIKLIIWLKACLDRDVWEGVSYHLRITAKLFSFWIELTVTTYWERAFLLEDKFLFRFFGSSV